MSVTETHCIQSWAHGELSVNVECKRSEVNLKIKYKSHEIKGKYNCVQTKQKVGVQLDPDSVLVLMGHQGGKEL